MYLFGTIIIIELALLAYGQLTQRTATQMIANRIVGICAEKPSTAVCYDKEIPKLLDHGVTFEKSFEVTRLIQSKDTSYTFCHVLGHALSAKETKKDPSKWKNVVARCPSGVCSNGCIHGAFQERFRSEFVEPGQMDAVKAELVGVCEPREGWAPTKLEQGACYHALGHLFMYMTNADVGVSGGLCDELVVVHKENDFRRTCYDGAFMQLFQPLEPEDTALVWGKTPVRSLHPTFCSAYSGAKHTACMSEGWPLYMPGITDPKEFASYCSLFSENEKNQCYIMSSLIMVVQFQFDMPRVRAFCTGLPEERVGACFASVATRLIEIDWKNTDEAVQWCGSAERDEAKKACFDELVIQSTFTYHPGSREYQHLCAILPAPWGEACRKKT